MWKSLSLQTRLSVLFCTMLMGAFALVLAGLFAFSINHLKHEREPAARLVAQIAAAINAELRAEPAQQAAIDRLLKRLNEVSAGNLRYRDANTTYASPAPSAFEIPEWFGRLIGAQRQPQPFPASTGQLMLYPSDAADVYEKWVAFLIIVGTPLVLGILAFGIAQLTVQATLRPLREAAAAISRLKDNDYSTSVSSAGPPEIRRACDEINALAGVLGSLRASNQAFMKRIVSAQDDERAEIGRDLHDEFGPLLFAARANAHALKAQHSDPRLAALADEISSIVEAIQKTNSRLLARLRPLDLEHLGLTRNIAGLIGSPAIKAGNLTADVKLDPALDQLDEVAARTLYRFVQEAITNVLRHAKASKARIFATIDGSLLSAEVSDDGIGMADTTKLGRGLEGMKERIRALGGTFLVSSGASGTIVRCTLPLS
jgi:two-component system sensor histidine kinase UhpB